MTSLAVLGVGLVSPAGATTRDHAFFLRAVATTPSPSPFVTADDEPLSVAYCPWIQPIDRLDARLTTLAVGALDEACAPLDALPTRPKIALYVCLPASRPGLSEDALVAVVGEVRKRAGASAVERVVGAAGAFGAIRTATDMLVNGATDVVVVVGVDSWVDAESLAGRRPRNPWLPRQLDPSEAGAAIVLTTARMGAQLGYKPIGQIHDSRTAMGAANDENDEAIDAGAMAALVYSLPKMSPMRTVFGQTRVDLLRNREWSWAVARMAERFDPEYHDACLEAEIGEVGAAAGVANLAYGFTLLRHAATPTRDDIQSPFAAWAISANGTRGIALAQAAAP